MYRVGGLSPKSWSLSLEEIPAQVIHKHFFEIPIPVFPLSQVVDPLGQLRDTGKGGGTA